ncbi:MAG TPA: hypothetical protein VN444_03685 [Verrucomicrobiae bacterium]|nr:hypothetical protein [Verrucomicrobiae bacterium]
MPDNERLPNWWHTVPGILTAIAGVVTAITGLLLALNQIGVFERKEKAQAPVMRPDGASTSPAKRPPQILQKKPPDTAAKPTPPPVEATFKSGTRRESPRTAQMDYDAVQALYGKHKRTDDCTEIRRIVAEISEYAGNQQPVPQDARYSVRFPSMKADPTIADLVTDRITRVRSVKAECFPPQAGFFVREDKVVPQVQVQPSKVPPDSSTLSADRAPTAQKAIQSYGFTFVLDQCKHVRQAVDCQFKIISNQGNRKLIILASSNSVANSGRQFSPEATVQIGPGKVQIGDTIVFMSGVSRQLKITFTDVPETTDMFAVMQLKLRSQADFFSVQFSDVPIEKGS